MGLLSKLKEIFNLNNNRVNSNNIIEIAIGCNKCEEEINSVFRKNYDLQINYGDEDWKYLINKQLVCPGCYQSIKLRIEYDNNLNQINSRLIGGKFLSEEDKHRSN
ncbi:hypothetical protein [Orenia marismortui]|uniref:hypothetical protein n=1 Tax=Orenia marismortui TaxID=46469 RepID=UPI00036C46C5|nr:hypothetical protein [Orenia marismortui]